MSSVAVEPYITPEEYLARERESDYRSEYFNGRIYAMSGASEAHILIVTNVAAELHGQFKGRPCKVYAIDMRLKVSPTGLYTYPDVLAVCGEARFDEARKDNLLNPDLVIEVLSPSTEAYDRGDKFAHYRRLQSVREYLLIAQDKARVERYIRQGEQWVLTEYSGLDASVTLESVGATLALREIYDKVELPSNTGLKATLQPE